MKKQLLIGGLILTGLAGCSKEAETLDNGDLSQSDHPIVLTLQVVGTPVDGSFGSQSRAAADPNQAMTFYFVRADETGEGTGVFGTYGNTELAATRMAGAGSTKLDFTTKQFYNINNAKSRFTGWWPAATSFSGGVASWTIDGTQDILTAALREGNIASPLPAFVFEHKLSKLSFEVMANDAGAAAIWGTISAVNVLAQPTTCTYTPATDAATGAISLSGTKTYAVQNFASGALTTTAVARGDAMFIAPSATDQSLQLTVTSSTRGAVTVAVPARSYEAGTSYKISLLFKGPQIAATVVPWDPVSSDYPGVGDPDVPIYLTDNEEDSPFVISPKSMESTSSLKWGPTTPTGVTDVYDGKGNTDKLMQMSATAYPAAKYCRDKGAEWYLPSQAQLMLMWTCLPAISEDWRPPINVRFWASTEASSNSSNAWFINFADGYFDINGSSKDLNYAARCIKDGASPTFGTWKYPKVENNNTIVSRDAAGGIKAKVLLTPAQKIFLMNQTTQPIYKEVSEYNGVSAKFEVASVDASKGTTWAGAYAACKGYSQGAFGQGSWRLPTQRELGLIWMFKAKLTGCGDIQSSTASFWAGAESSYHEDWAWFVSFTNGVASPYGKNDPFAVRCIRDVN